MRKGGATVLQLTSIAQRGRRGHTAPWVKATLACVKRITFTECATTPHSEMFMAFERLIFTS